MKGECVVIYDTDDKPCKNQLIDVVKVFRNSESNLACVQARLNYYNAHKNLLTRLFTIGYTIIFNYTLPALEGLDLFIPFKRHSLVTTSGTMS
ncbi:MAG: hypothetical protein AB8V23_05310 [Candidatus Midichloria sp.]